MPRTSVLLVMLFAILWQSVVFARSGSAIKDSADVEHSVLHWQDEGHHHHEDGSYHQDESSESALHLLGDHVSASVLPLVPSSHDIPPLRSVAPVGLPETGVPGPALEGLLRPPRSRS